MKAWLSAVTAGRQNHAVQNLRYKRNSKLNSKPSSKLGTKFVSVLKLIAILFFGSIAANANAQSVDIGPAEYPAAKSSIGSASDNVTMAITILNGTIPDGATVQWFSFERDATNPTTPKIDSKQNISGATERTFVVGRDYDSQRPFLGVEIGGFSTGNRGFAVAGVPASRSSIGNGDTRGQVFSFVSLPAVIVGSTIRLSYRQARTILGNNPSDNAFNIVWQRTNRYGNRQNLVSLGVGNEYIFKAGDFAPGQAYIFAEVTDNSYTPNGFGTGGNAVTKIYFNSNSLFKSVQATGGSLPYGSGDQLAIEAIGNYAANSTLTINTSRFNDHNGNGVFTAEWVAVNRSTGATINSFATGLSYVVDVSDFPEAQRADTDIKVLVRHTDALGLNQNINNAAVAQGSFIITFVPPVWRLVPPAPSGSLSIVPTGTGPTAGRTQNDELRGTPIDGLNLNGFSFQWQGRQIGSTSESAWADISRFEFSSAQEATLKYTGTGNAGTWDGNHEVLRLSANLGNPFGSPYVYVTEPFTLNLLPPAAPSLTYVGVTDVSNMRMDDANNDPNGGPRNYSFHWHVPGNAKFGSGGFSGGNGQNINMVGINQVAAGIYGTIIATLPDYFNFSSSFTIAIRFAEASVRIENTQLNVSLYNYGEIVRDVVNIQWHRSAVNQGPLGPAIAGAETSMYAVPPDFDTAFPYFSAEIVYNTPFHPNNVVAGRITQLTAHSPRISGQGLQGTLKIATATNYRNNAVITANVSDLSNIFGDVPAITDLQYQWQTGTSTLSTDTWTNVGTKNNTGRFTLRTTDFDNTRKYLRIVGSSSNQTLTTAPLNIDRPITNIRIDLVSPGALGNYAPGAVLRLAPDGFTDPNGVNTYNLRWSKTVGNVTTALKIGGTYTVKASDFPPTENAVLAVDIFATDAFGFGFTVRQVVPLQVALSGTMFISGRDFTRNGVFTADFSNVTDPNGTLNIDYQWQVNRPLPLVDDPNSPPNTVPANAPEWIPVPNDLFIFNNPFDNSPDGRVSPARNINLSTFSLLPKVASLPEQEPRWNPRLVSLRVRAVHTDGFNVIATLYSQPIRLNKSTKGAPLLDISPTGENGATLVSVDFSKITDGNSLNYPPQFADGGPGQGTFYYQWENFQGNVPLGTEPVYQLTDNDIRAIRAGFQPQLRVTYRDGIGFGRQWIMPIDILEVAVAQNGRNFVSALTDNGLQSGTYSYQWLQSSIVIRSGILPNTSGEYTPIISVTSANYAVDTATYDNSKPFIRLLVRSSLAIPITTTATIVTCNNGPCRSGDTNKVTAEVTTVNLTGRIVRRQALSEPFLVAGITAGTVQIQQSGNSPITYTANSSNLRNVFGELPPQLTYQWLRGKVSIYGPFAPPNAWEPIDGETSQTYALNSIDFPGASRYLQVVVSDGSGYFPLVNFVPNQPPPPPQVRLFGVPVGVSLAATIAIGGNSSPAQTLTAIVAGFGDTVTYRWQGGSADGIWENLADRNVFPYVPVTASTYTFPQDNSGIKWNVNLVSVRVIASNSEDSLTAVMLLNEPTEGTPIIVVEATDSQTVVSVDVDSLTDANGKGSVSTYQWINNDGSLKSGETGASYLLTPQDIQNAGTNIPPGVVIIYRDGLGFATRYTVLVATDIVVSISLVGTTVTSDISGPTATVVANSFVYAWQNSQTEGGAYENIASATDTFYAVPEGYDVLRPFVQLQLSYRYNDGSSGIRTSILISPRLRIAGVASGGVMISSGEVTAGATRSVDISALRDVLGRAVQVDNLTYQWQSGEDGNFSDIENATQNAYILVATDFVNGGFLRARVRDKAGLANNLFTPAAYINDPTDGSIRVDGELALNNTLTAVVSITDDNGIGQVIYTWIRVLRGGGGASIVIGNDTTYTVQTDDITRAALRLVVIVQHRDGLGFDSVIGTATIAVEYLRSGTVSVTAPAALSVGGVYRADVSGLLNFLNEPPLVADLRYQYQSGTSTLTADSTNANNWTNIGTQNIDGSYTIFAADFDNARKYLRLTAEDANGDTTGNAVLTSRAFNVDAPIQDITETLVSPGLNGERSIGAVLEIIESAVRDPNGNFGRFTYRWVKTLGGVRTTLSQTKTYTVEAADWTPADNGATLEIEVSGTDALGFSSTVVQTIPLLAAPQGDINVRGEDFTIDGVFSADISALSDANGTRGVEYEWQVNDPARLVNDPNAPSNTKVDATGWIPVPNSVYSIGNPFNPNPPTPRNSIRNVDRETFGLVPNNLPQLPGGEHLLRWNPAWLSLRVQVVHTDGLNQKTTLFSQPINVDKPTQGAPRLNISVLTGGTQATMVNVDFSAISDVNSKRFQPAIEFVDDNNVTMTMNIGIAGPGQGRISYRWENFQGNVQLGAKPVYQLTDSDIAAIKAGYQPQLRAIYRDGLGFSAQWIIPIDILQVSVTQTGRRLSSTLLDEGLQRGTYSYQWLQASIIVRSFVPPNTPSEYKPIEGATSATYNIDATTYDQSNPFVRLLVRSSLAVPITITAQIVTCNGGICNSGSTNKLTTTVTTVNLTGRIITRQAMSQPVLVAGITVGTVTIRQSGTGFNASYTADISALRDVYGDTPSASALRYQWLASTVSIYGPPAAPDAWRPIANATGQTYNFNPEDLQGVEKYLQVVIIDPSKYYSASVRLNGEAATLDIAFRTDILTANLTENTYSLGSPLTAALYRTPSSGAQSVLVTSGDIKYRWEYSEYVPYDNIDIWQLLQFQQTSNTYDITALGKERLVTLVSSSGTIITTYPAADRGVSVRAIAFAGRITIVTDGFISDGILLDHPTEGKPNVDELFVGVNDRVASVSFVDVSDLNGEGDHRYQWVNNNDTLKVGATGQTYTLSSQDIRNLNVSLPPKVMITYRDSLGYPSLFTLTVQTNLEISLTLTGYTISGTRVGNLVSIERDTDSYAWQNNATETGTYTNIEGATNTLYTIAVDYDASIPFLRLSYSYRNINGGQDTISSKPFRVAGIAEGTVGLLSGGFAAGAVQSVNISTLRDVLGRNVLAQNVSYQWQNGGADGGAIFTNIAGATLSLYTINGNDFSSARSFLRVRVLDNAKLSDDLIASSVQINKESTGAVAISGVPIAVGDVLTVTVADLQDANGIGQLSYEWLRLFDDGAFQAIGGNSSVYAVQAADFASEVRSLVVSVTHRDALYFANQVGGANINVQEGSDGVSNRRDATGSISIDSRNGFAEDAVFVANHDITDVNGTVTLSYQWYRARTLSPEGAPVGLEEIRPAATGQTFALRGWNASFEVLQVIIKHIDVFNDATPFTATVLINQPLLGAPVLQRADSGVARRLENDLRLSINIGNLRDANNATSAAAGAQGRVSTYMWFGSNGTVLPNGTSQVYKISTGTFERDSEGLLIGSPVLSVAIAYQDGIGFQYPLVVAVTLEASIPVEMEQIRDLGAVLNAGALSQAARTIGSHLGNVSGGKINTPGLVSNSANSTQFYINDVAVEGSNDLTRAFANRQTDSLHADKIFALDNFAVESGGSGAFGWSSWVQGNWGIMEGDPKVEGRNGSYRGKSFALYGGMDGEVGEFRVGVGFGYQEAILDATLGDNGERNDKIDWNVLSLIPYLEWSNQLWRLRVLAGYGEGEIDIYETDGGGCQATLDTELGFGKVDAEYTWLSGSGWDLNLHSGLEKSSGLIGKGQCADKGFSALEKIPNIKSNSGEGVFGARVNFDNSDGFDAFMSTDVRKSFGDLEDSAALDIGAGVNILSGRWGMHLEGVGQIDRWATHRRHSVSGTLRYEGGGWRSQWRAGLENDGNNNSGELVHRWSIDNSSAWGLNRINSGVYFELHDQADKAGAEMRMEF